MAASSITGFVPTVTSASKSATGTSSMSSGDFMKVMLAQLQQQDPLDPAKSDQLLTQMSQISQLQSNQELAANLKGLSLQQSIGAGGNLIGKTVAGIDDGGDKVTGIVTSVKVEDKQVYLELDSGKTLQLGSVTQIAPNTATNSSLAAQALAQSPDAQLLMQALGGTNNATTASGLAQLASTSQGQALIQQLLAAQNQASNSSSSPLSGILSMLGLK